MTFDKEVLVTGKTTTVYDRIIGQGRWSIHRERVFQHEGKFYRTRYSEGATENQEESPYDDQPDQIECPEVFPQTRSVVVYETESESQQADAAVDPVAAK